MKGIDEIEEEYKEAFDKELSILKEKIGSGKDKKKSHEEFKKTLNRLVASRKKNLEQYYSKNKASLLELPEKKKSPEVKQKYLDARHLDFNPTRAERFNFRFKEFKFRFNLFFRKFRYHFIPPKLKFIFFRIGLFFSSLFTDFKLFFSSILRNISRFFSKVFVRVKNISLKFYKFMKKIYSKISFWKKKKKEEGKDEVSKKDDESSKKSDAEGESPAKSESTPTDSLESNS